MADFAKGGEPSYLEYIALKNGRNDAASRTVCQAFLAREDLHVLKRRVESTCGFRV